MSFARSLRLMLQKEVADLCHSHGLAIEWPDLLRDLDRLQEAPIEKDGKRITTRTTVAGQVGRVFQAAGIALPPKLYNTPPIHRSSSHRLTNTAADVIVAIAANPSTNAVRARAFIAPRSARRRGL
jgi:hypothetical protein